MRCKLTEKTMSQPAAGGAAFRVRLIASVPICMALAVHVSCNEPVHFIRGHLDGCFQQGVMTCDPDQGQAQGHSDPYLTWAPRCGPKESEPVGKASGWAGELHDQPELIGQTGHGQRPCVKDPGVLVSQHHGSI